MFNSNSLWELHDTAWRNVTLPNMFSPRHAVAVTYDLARGQPLLVGGVSQFGQAFGDTHVWDGTTLDPAPAVVFPPVAPMAYDALRGRVVTFHGADTFEWDGTAWADLTPPTLPDPRVSVAMAYGG